MRKIIKVVVGTVLLVLLSVALQNMYSSVIRMVYPLKYEAYIKNYSEEYGLDEYFVMAVIKAESNYKLDAHSGIARGLMQITDGTAEWIAEKMKINFSGDDIENPELNIKMGCYYLRHLFDKYNNETLVLAAYNAGMGNVSKWLEDTSCSSDSESLDYIPFRETRDYVERVKKYRVVYEKLYG